MKRALLLASLALAGCQTNREDTPSAPVAMISGPLFAETRFDCGRQPLPPDPALIGDRAASAAAHYENALGAWGRRCRNQLASVGTELKGAGQVGAGGRCASEPLGTCEKQNRDRYIIGH